MSLINIMGVSKSYHEGKVALQKSFFSIEKGQRVGIIGETASGKSTLLKIMAGLVQADTGHASFMGEKIKGPDHKLVPGHESIAYLSQDISLPKFIKVRDYLVGLDSISEIEENIINSCQIETLLEKDTRQLSGGERQRIALAKKLIQEPEVLLLDEPFSNQDYHHKQTMKRVVREIEASLSITLVMVTHDPRDVLPWADMIYVLRKGSIIQQASSKELYQYPINEYVAGLLGSYSVINTHNWSLTGATSLIIRPNQVEITDEVTNAKKGTVKEINFNGAYDEVLIKTAENEMVIIHTTNDQLTLNDIIFLKLKSNTV